MPDPVNTFALTPNISTSGQPDEAQFHTIADQGFDLVVNLAMHDSENALPNEGNLVASLGMSYINIPVPFDDPTADHLKHFIGVMETFSDKKIWVHCAVNARVSAFMYQYLTLTGKTDASSATTPLLEKWRPKMDDVWRDFLTLTDKDIQST